LHPFLSLECLDVYPAHRLRQTIFLFVTRVTKKNTFGDLSLGKNRLKPTRCLEHRGCEMNAISKENQNHITYEEELKRRAWETMPRMHKLILFIHEKFVDAPFDGPQLYNEFLKNCHACRDVLRQSMEELKKKGYVVQFKRISYKKRLWIATAKLFEIAASIQKNLDEQIYVTDLPNGTLQLRGHLRPLRKSGSGSHLHIFSKALSNVSNKRVIHCEIYRFKDAIIVRAGRGTRKAYSRDWDIDLSIPKRLLYKNELEALKTGKIVPTTVYIVPEDWGLEKWDFFTETVEARELVRALSKYFVIDTLPSHNYHINKWRFDIVTENFVVEITTHKPRSKCGPHSSQASTIEARVLEAVLYSLEKNKKSIVVISGMWHEKPYFRDLKATVQAYGCYIIFADFGKAIWAEEIASQIVEILKCP
jgi:hypothetical protein